MKQFNLVDVRTLKKEEVPDPKPGPKDVIIRIKSCGICGSDIHSYKGKHPFVRPPIVLGHEFAGIVESVGSEVSRFKPGDAVTAEPNMVCGKCYNCRHGRYNICENLQVIGNVGYDGAFADFLSMPEHKVVKLPQNMDYDLGAMVEPAAVAIHAVRESGLSLGDHVLVVGAGTIGLMTLQTVREAGAAKIIVSDVVDARLKLASELGADIVFNPANSKQSLLEFVQDQFGPDKADLIFDCVSIQATVDSCIEAARKGTRIMLVGVPEEPVNTNLAFVQDRELELVGTLMYRMDDFKIAADYIANGKIEAKKLISHTYPFDKLEEAFEMAENPDNLEEKIKIMVEF
jgi:L-iditol 2-dehydrogenase